MLALRGRSLAPLRIMLTSVAGAMAHNLGQVLMAVAIVRTPGLLTVYLLPLEGIGAVVGCVTGAAAWRVIRAVGRGQNAE